MFLLNKASEGCVHRWKNRSSGKTSFKNHTNVSYYHLKMNLDRARDCKKTIKNIEYNWYLLVSSQFCLLWRVWRGCVECWMMAGVLSVETGCTGAQFSLSQQSLWILYMLYSCFSLVFFIFIKFIRSSSRLFPLCPCWNIFPMCQFQSSIRQKSPQFFLISAILSKYMLL